MCAARPKQTQPDRTEDADDSEMKAEAQRETAPEPRVPALRIVPLYQGPRPRRFPRVPTHAISVVPEQRVYPRATLQLPLRLRSVAGIVEEFPATLVTRDISSTGVYFLCPRPLEPGAAIELDVVLVNRPLGRGNVVMTTRAHVLRAEPAAVPGWHGIAASFDDVDFGRDDHLPERFDKT